LVQVSIKAARIDTMCVELNIEVRSRNRCWKISNFN